MQPDYEMCSPHIISFKANCSHTFSYLLVKKYIVSIWLWLASTQIFMQGWFRFSSSITARKINPEPHDDVGSVRRWKWNLQGISIDTSTLGLLKNGLAHTHIQKTNNKSNNNNNNKSCRRESIVRSVESWKHSDKSNMLLQMESVYFIYASFTWQI